jgi:hypothetical protein
MGRNTVSFPKSKDNSSTPLQKPKNLQARSCKHQQQNRLCTYNIPIRHVGATIFAREISNYYIFWECVCSLTYPACNADVQNCSLWPAQFHNIFPHYLINNINFGKSLLNIKCVFSIQILSETFLILTRIKRDMIKNVTGLKVKYRLFSSSFNKTWTFLTEFQNQISNSKKTSPVEAELTCRQMDRHEEANSCFSKFCEHA